jgi:hypothetical protein
VHAGVERGAVTRYIPRPRAIRAIASAGRPLPRTALVRRGAAARDVDIARARAILALA